jgi:hypothetical protein
MAPRNLKVSIKNDPSFLTVPDEKVGWDGYGEMMAMLRLMLPPDPRELW